MSSKTPFFDFHRSPRMRRAFGDVIWRLRHALSVNRDAGPNRPYLSADIERLTQVHQLQELECGGRSPTEAEVDALARYYNTEPAALIRKTFLRFDVLTRRSAYARFPLTSTKDLQA